MDMSKSYRAAFEEYLPEIDIVFDRFHVMQIVNKAVDSVRKNQQKALDKEGIKTLKGGRFLPLWNFENLNPLKQERLKYMLEANEPLFIIHSMKEQLRLLWNQPNEEKARGFLNGVNLSISKTSDKRGVFLVFPPLLLRNSYSALFLALNVGLIF